MKTLIHSVLFVITINLLSFGQQAKPLSFEKIEVVSKTKSEIYIATRLWFYKNFQSYEGVISVDDLNSGIIYGKGVLPMDNGGGNVKFSIKFYFKEGTYKVIVDDLVHEWLFTSGGQRIDLSVGLLTEAETSENKKRFLSNNNTSKKSWESVKNQSTIKINYLLKSLNQTIINNKEMDF